MKKTTTTSNIEKLEMRLNNKHKSFFYRHLRSKGNFLSFNEESKEHHYAVNVDAEFLEEVLEPTAFNGLATLYVTIRDGAVKVLKAF
ncbi:MULTISPECIES: hypothetical protein [Solibacillus]|uniref:hypothetical protein n=1 Tax=Solibacillus TaxID=648800 RepID=UPI0007FB3C5B|nr:MULTISPECIES: hypothetical protein [Solibacillus]OBW54610.1 hypothetical protein A9986_13335 [Solibacillus silvestris]